jgi:autotransporter-associated beta strand protein
VILGVGGIIGNSSAPIDSLTLDNSILTLPASASAATAVASTLNINGTSDTINVNYAPGVGQFQLIVYTTLNGAYDFTLGTLPSGFQGYLSNNVSTLSVDLVITNVLIKSDTWRGNVNGNWDTSTQNWLSSGNPAAYGQGDFVTFDDTLTGTANVNLTTTLTPGSITFNNSTINYNLSGSGKLSGFSGLTNLGTGTVTLSETGGDNFSGGIMVAAGKVILNNTNSAITGSLIVSSGATAQIGNNSANGALPAGSVTIDGALVFSRTSDLTVSTPITGGGTVTKSASGKLTFSAANTYSGNTTVNSGTLALSGPGTLANSPEVSVSAATLDVSGVSSTFVNQLDLTNATLNVSLPYGQTPVNVNALNMGGAGNTFSFTSLPPVASYPVTIKVLQSASTISGFNGTLGSLPAAPPSYAGSISQSGDQTAVLLTLTAGPIGQRPYVSWSGGASPDLNWSQSANWQLPGPPGATDNVIFSDVAAVGDRATVDNIVNGTFTLPSLTYSNSTSGTWHVTQIPTGTTLTVNNFTVGGLLADGAVSSAAMVDGGTLLVTGNFTNANSGTANSTANATLDLSGLSNFVHNAAGGVFNLGANGSRSIGNLIGAAASNSITCARIEFETSANSSSVAATWTLGAGTNRINASIINIGAQRSAGTLNYNTVSGGIRIRGTAGGDNDRANMTLGNRNAGGTSGTSRGRLFFNDHPVDAKLGTVIAGQCNQASPVGAEGNIQFNTGTIDATTINMAINSSSGTNTVGTITVGTNSTAGGIGTLIVANSISLVNQTGGAGAAVGTLDIPGGIVNCGSNIVKTTTLNSTGNISVTSGGTLKVGGVTGTPAAPIDTLTLDTATLRLNLDGTLGAATVVATTVSASGTTTLKLDSISGVSIGITYPLISYTGTDPFSALTLGPLSAGYVGTLVDDTGSSQIGITFSAVPLAPPTIGSITTSGNNLVFSGSGGPANANYVVVATTNITVPRTNWTRIATNSFDGSGNFSYSTPIDTTKPVRFFSILIP